jgi:hypothetical protein
VAEHNANRAGIISTRNPKLGAAHEYLSHCSGASMTADAHEPPQPALTERRYNAAHSQPPLTERRYNSSHDALGAGADAGAAVVLAVAGAAAGAVELGGALSFLAVPLSDLASA